MKNYQIEVKWALVFVIFTLLWMYLEKLFGLHGEHIDQHPVYTNLFAIPAIAIFVFALLDKRKNFYGGIMSFRQGFISGLIITVIITILTPLTQTVISKVISPDYFENAIAHAVEQDKMTREKAENYFNLQSYLLLSTITSLVMGLVTSLVVAFIVKKKS